MNFLEMLQKFCVCVCVCKCPCRMIILTAMIKMFISIFKGYRSCFRIVRFPFIFVSAKIDLSHKPDEAIKHKEQWLHIQNTDKRDVE